MAALAHLRDLKSKDVKVPFLMRQSFLPTDKVCTVKQNQNLNQNSVYSGFKLGRDWGEILALGGSKSPWEVPRAIQTLPSIFCNFMKSL